jgi:outer membrane lipoprotein-sorting protein
MRTLLCGLVVTLATLGVTHSANADGAADLQGILDHVDDLYIEKASHASVTMHIVTEHATRDMSLESWTRGQDKVLVRISAPEKEQGTTTLKSGPNVWNYFPKINQVTKVSGSLMSASWMGSHVTNSEIVKRTRMSASYTYAKTFEGERGGDKVLEITLDPKPDAAVVWGKVIVTVRQIDKSPTQIKYFDEAKTLAQTWTYTDVKRLGGHDVPTTIKVVPASKPSESTEVRYKSIEFNPTMSDDLFSQRSLQK